MNKPEAVIYLSDARTRVQDDQYRSYQSLKESFYDLVAFNDETLAAGASITHHGATLIIPLVGDIYTDRSLSPGQAQIINDPTISNPFKEELVNYLLISFKERANAVVNFNLIDNKLQHLFTGVSIGKFDGRIDDTYKISGKGIFAFAIEGAFEVQNRLLHPRDGLALWNLDEVEFEALSNEALLLLIEVK